MQLHIKATGRSLLPCGRCIAIKAPVAPEQHDGNRDADQDEEPVVEIEAERGIEVPGRR